jgi:hypothetical protein
VFDDRSAKVKKIKALKSSTPCPVCNQVPTDRAHIRSKGAGGSWADDNIIQLCRQHHSEQHQGGWIKFIEKYKTIGEVLKSKGWEVRDVLGVTKLVRK